MKIQRLLMPIIMCLSMTIEGYATVSCVPANTCQCRRFVLLSPSNNLVNFPNYNFLNNANTTIETSGKSLAFPKSSENEFAPLVTPNISATTRTTDTAERQMTLEERIESMLNKSKSNGIADGNKSKAEDTNFGDEADITDLLN